MFRSREQDIQTFATLSTCSQLPCFATLIGLYKQCGFSAVSVVYDSIYVDFVKHVSRFFTYSPKGLVLKPWSKKTSL